MKTCTKQRFRGGALAIFGCVAALLAAGCKSSARDPSESREERSADGRGAPSFRCDCLGLLPVETRPRFPRVSRASEAFPNRCEYRPAVATGGGADRTLVVVARQGADESKYLESVARRTAAFVRVEGAGEKTLADGTKVHGAIGIGGSDKTHWAVLYAPAVGYIFEVSEEMETDTEVAAPEEGPDVVRFISGRGQTACKVQ